MTNLTPSRLIAGVAVAVAAFSLGVAYTSTQIYEKQ